MRRHLLTLALTVGLVMTGTAPATAADDDPGVIVYERTGPPSGTAGHDLVAVTPDAQTFTTLVSDVPRDVSLSPNGRWIAFIEWTSYYSSDVWISRVDGTAARRVHTGEGWSNPPSWSPDGRRLAFGEEPDVLRVLDLVAGTREQHLAPRCTPAAIDWSPSGDRLAFTDRCGSSTPDADQYLYVYSTADDTFRQLTGNADELIWSEDADPTWSPDGQHIAFARYPTGTTNRKAELRVIEADGTDERVVATDERETFPHPAWSPDGRQLAFSRGADQDGNLSVWRMNADGSDQRRVTTVPDGVGHVVQDWRVLSTSTASACPPGAVPDAGFDDVSGAHADAVDCAVWHGLASGRSADTYAPAMPVRRDQIATFLARLLERAGVELPEPTGQGFTDIDGNTHADAINQLAELGIITGTTATTYRPAAPMTRAQMAALLVRTYEDATGTTLPRAIDEFDDDNGTTHEAAIDKTANAGFAGGTSVSRYQPGGNVRRDQMATFLTRITNRLVRDGHVSLPQ